MNPFRFLLILLFHRFTSARRQALANEESALPNAALCERTFEVLQPDSLFVPYGDFLHKQSGKVQRFDAESAKRMKKQFHGLVANAKRTLGDAPRRPVYEGHPDVPGMQGIYTDRAAKGWIEGITLQADGAQFHVKWNPTGAQLIANGEFAYYSPFWEVEGIAGNVVRPVSLRSIGLTNNPNIPVPAIANDQSSESETEPMKLNPAILALLALSEGFDVAALENAITNLNTRATNAERDLALANTKATEAETALANAKTTHEVALKDYDASVIGKVNALANDLTAAREALVQTGIASLQLTGHLVPADAAPERTRILALANVADITAELARLGKQAPKIKLTSITVDAPGSQAKVQALANDAQARRDEFNKLVKARERELANSGTEPQTAYTMAFNEVSRTNADLLKPAA